MRRSLLVVDVFFGDREIDVAAGRDFDLETINVAGRFDRLRGVDQLVARMDRIFDDQCLGARIDVVHGVSFLRDDGVRGDENAVVGVERANLVGMRILVGGDAGAEIDAVADEAFVGFLIVSTSASPA